MDGRQQPVDERFNLLEVIDRLPEPAPGRDNPRLAELYAADQDVRTKGRLDQAAVAADRDRRDEVLALLGDGAVRTPADFHRAAMVFQHGTGPSHFHLAFELARRSAQHGNPRTRWLAAAAMDRWLMNQGLPQKFGTQFFDGGRGLELYDVDRGTSDEEREAWNVPTLAAAHDRVDRMNAKSSDA